MITSSPISVLGICGSLRNASFNWSLLQAAAKHLPKEMNLESIRLHDIPLFNQDVLDAGMPSSVQTFRDRIAAADALLICSPEYNYSISGVLKNAIDWASRPPNQPLNGKPLGIMGATPGNFGTVRAQMALRQVCVFTNMVPLLQPEVLVMKAETKFDSQRNLTDEVTKKILIQFLEAFAMWIRKLRGY